MGRFVDWLRGLAGPPSLTVVREDRLHPNPQLDADDPYLSALTGGASFDSVRAAETCRALYERHLMARRIIRLDLDYVVGANVEAELQFEDADPEFHRAELARWAARFGIDARWWQDLYRRLLLDGEIAVKLLPTPEGVRPVPMSTVEWDLVGDPETGDVVALQKRGHLANPERWSVINGLTPDPDRGRSAGVVAYFRHDAAPCDPDRVRGVPELLPLISRLRWEEEVTRTGVRRVKSMLRWFWQAKVMGAAQEQLDELNRKYSRSPDTGSVRWTNEHVDWTAVTPDLGAYETSRFLGDLRATIAGGAGHPAHWHGDGGDANLATATAMGSPSFRQMERFQGEFRSMVEDVLEAALASLRDLGRVGDYDPDGVSWDVTLPQIDARDYQVGTTSLVQAAAAVSALKSDGYITHEAAQRLLSTVIEKVLGVALTEADLAEEPEPPDPYTMNPPPPPPEEGSEEGDDEDQGSGFPS